jgi:hypothetical protein
MLQQLMQKDQFGQFCDLLEVCAKKLSPSELKAMLNLY